MSLSLPSADPAKRRRALERVTGQLLAKMRVPPDALNSRQAILAQLGTQPAKAQTKWGWVQAPEFAGLLASEEWTPEGVVQWLNYFVGREAAWKEGKRRIFEDNLTEYLSMFFTDEAKAFSDLVAAMRLECKNPLSPHVTFLSGPNFTPKVVLRHLEGLNADAQQRILDRTKQKIRHHAGEEKLRKELESRLQDIAGRLGVGVEVAELAEHAERLWGVKVYVGDRGDIFDFEGSFEQLSDELAELVEDEARSQMRKCRTEGYNEGSGGMVWGLDEDRLLTVTAFARDGGAAEFHVHMEDEAEALDRLKYFIKRTGVKRLVVEDLSGLEDVKSRLDGPLSVESPAWRRKMEACNRLQPKLQQLGIDIMKAKSTTETYTRCPHCGELLTRDLRLKHRHDAM